MNDYLLRVAELALPPGGGLHGTQRDHAAAERRLRAPLQDSAAPPRLPHPGRRPLRLHRRHGRRGHLILAGHVLHRHPRLCRPHQLERRNFPGEKKAILTDET